MILQLEISIIEYLNSLVLSNEFFRALTVVGAIYIVPLGGALVFWLLALTLLPRYRLYREERVEMIFAVLVGSFISYFVFVQGLRYFLPRPRPTEVIDGVYLLIQHMPSFSFPSAHAAVAFSIATVMYYYYPKVSLALFFLGVLTGIARVAAGAHWPSDVLGGAILGIVGGILIVRGMERSNFL